MSESALHVSLVRTLHDYAATSFGAPSEISIRNDSVTAPRGARPPLVGGYIPDLYAIDVPTTKMLIGEAKTARDLELSHSVEQFDAFLRHLRQVGTATMVVSVPFGNGPAACKLLRDRRRIVTSETVELVILETSALGGWIRHA